MKLDPLVLAEKKSGHFHKHLKRVESWVSKNYKSIPELMYNLD